MCSTQPPPPPCCHMELEWRERCKLTTWPGPNFYVWIWLQCFKVTRVPSYLCYRITYEKPYKYAKLSPEEKLVLLLTNNQSRRLHKVFRQMSVVIWTKPWNPFFGNSPCYCNQFPEMENGPTSCFSPILYVTLIRYQVSLTEPLEHAISSPVSHSGSLWIHPIHYSPSSIC